MSERIAILEVGLDDLRLLREHDQGILGRIDANVTTVVGQMSAITQRQEAIEHRQAVTEQTVSDIQDWRQGLLSEIRGALKIPKVVLAATPVAVFVLALVNALRPA